MLPEIDGNAYNKINAKDKAKIDAKKETMITRTLIRFGSVLEPYFDEKSRIIALKKLKIRKQITPANGAGSSNPNIWNVGEYQKNVALKNANRRRKTPPMNNAHLYFRLFVWLSSASLLGRKIVITPQITKSIVITSKSDVDFDPIYVSFGKEYLYIEEITNGYMAIIPRNNSDKILILFLF